ncbi:MAG: htpG [Chlamydiales bacterium]|jgi:molecular chaperone HtpG|nr:htpG [Chlamydiales bacterium]
MATGNLQIHTENILPIIKKWLYSDKVVFVRELVSNACDAIHKLKVLREKGETQALDDEFRVEIKIDKDARTLTFSDTGLGMDKEEVEKYIAQVAFSGAEDFLKKYTTSNEKDQIIGHFGLGFYSSYMVASKVEILTLSYKQNAEPVFWSCDGTSSYEIDKGNRTERGTTITLYVDQDNDEFLDEAQFSTILKRYCSFLPYPIYLNGQHINVKEPLWMKSPSECTDEEYLEFYRHLYPMDEDPVLWVHLNVDYPFNLKGILYFPKWKRHIDFNKNDIHLYCNRVFVSDQCQEIIPNYLMILKGAIDSPDIPLNVSRSSLQMDRTVRQLATHISKKVADKLSSVYRNNRERFLEIWNDLEVITKFGAMQDDKFYKNVKDCLIWKNLNDEWTTIEDYLGKHKEEYKDKIFYATEEQQQSHLTQMYRAKGIEVLRSNELIDQGMMSFLEREMTPVKFQRIDAAVDELLVDASREKGLLDAEGRTEASKIAEMIRNKLNLDQVDVEAKSLASDNITGFIMLDENARRLRDYMSRSNMGGFDAGNMFGKKTFVVNTNNSLIQAIPQIADNNSELASDLVKHVYDLALLSQNELSPNQLGGFVSRSTHVLEELAKALANTKQQSA